MLFSNLTCRFLFAFLVTLFFCQAQGRLLTEGEMHAFLNVHATDIQKALPGAHPGYGAIAVAYEKMQDNPFADHQKNDANTYYTQVILSILRGIGFGGISCHQKASEAEEKVAIQALYTIGYNLKDTFSFEPHTPHEQEHFHACNTFLNLGKAQEETTVRGMHKTYTFAKIGTPSFGLDFRKETSFLRFYRTSLENAQEALHKKAQEQIESMYKWAVGFRESPAKPSSPPSPPKSASCAAIPTEPWAGILYRHKRAAEKAICRGESDPISQCTGNLIVRAMGKSTYGSSTATLFLQSPGVVMAITNAHCVVAAEGDIISSISLNFPGGKCVFFDTVYIHPDYRNGIYDYDVAILKGKSQMGLSLSFIPLLEKPIEPETKGNGYMISHAKVNYLEAGKIQTQSDCARTLSVQRIERVVGTKIHLARLVQADGPLSEAAFRSNPVYFKPLEESHELDAVFSSGCSGSPFFLKINDFYYLAGLLDSSIFTKELGLPIRISNISTIYTYLKWIENVKMGTEKESYRVACPA